MIVIKLVDKEFHGKCCEVCENKPMPMLGDGKLAIDTLKSIIDCELLDIVGIGHGISAWVDDEGLFTKQGQWNWIATALRTLDWAKRDDVVVPCNYPPLCGNVVLLGGVDDEGNQLDLNDEQVKYITDLIGKGEVDNG